MRLMTYNIGGVKETGFSLQDVMAVIQKIQPDILSVQEITEILDLDGNWARQPEMIAEALGYGENYFFGPVMSLREHFHARKALFVDGIFNGWQDWQHGNAIFSRWPFARLGDRSKPGRPENIPLYTPLRYQGTRNTDPRGMLLARIGQAPFYPYVISTHFTTLLGEHEREGKMNLKANEEAKIMRWKQAQRLLDVITKHVLEKGELVFLMGDLNAAPSELCLSGLLQGEGNFVRLQPENPIPTHPKISEPVDHILIHAGKRRVEYRCWILEDMQCKRASDHLPVVTDIKIYDENSPRHKELGPGVIREET